MFPDIFCILGNMRKLEFFVLLLILIGAFGVRLYKFNSPVADWHSWRQADTSSVSRNFVKEGIDFLHPKFDDLSMGVSLIDNPQGYRFVEFPIYNGAQASLFKYIGGLTLEQWGRMVSIISSVFSIVFIYLLVKKYVGIQSALFSALFFAFIPYNIYYGRAILPDSAMVMAMLGGTYFFDSWIGRSGLKIYDPRFALALLFTACAFLLKPYALFFTLPMIYIGYKSFGLSFLRKWQLWFFLVLSLAPLGFWQVWIRQYPAGIPRNDWLFNGNGIRFSGSFFHWIFAQRIGQFILGYFGLPFVILGILRKVNKKEGWLFFTFIASSLLYISVLATGNVQHDYYQVLIIPTLAIFFGKGAGMVIENAGDLFNKRTSYIVVSVSMIFMLAFGWFVIRDFYNIQHPEIITAGIAVDKITPKDAKIVAPYGGDGTLLYNTNRKGWPVFDRSLEDFIKQGADYMLFVNPTAPELNFKNYFATVEQKDTYIIYDLSKPLKPIK